MSDLYNEDINVELNEDLDELNEDLDEILEESEVDFEADVVATSVLTPKKKIDVNFLFIGALVLLVIYCISILSPIAWGLMTSVKNIDDFRNNILGLPSFEFGWAFDNYPYVLNLFEADAVYNGKAFTVDLMGMLVNTLMYVVGCSLLSTLMPCLVSYVVAKFPNVFSNIIYAIVLVTMMIPIVGTYPSEIVMLKNLNLYNTMLGAWVQKMNFLGMYFLVFHATFVRLSKDFSEAAELDGANEFTVMFQIILPLVANIFFTVFLIFFISYWNDYQTPHLYFPAYPTIAYGSFYMAQQYHSGLETVPLRMTSCIIVVIPILILFILFSERLMSNISMGGLKE